jgi:NAD(P)-dependent dehydrogenase (short-subunit alcohol dehydrogenase family)
MGAYGNSKLMNVMFTYELVRHLAGSVVTANVLHPGFVRTGFGKNVGGLFKVAISAAQMFALSPEQGADTIVYLASSPEVEGITGKYWDKRKPIRSNTQSYNEADQRRLWEASAKIAGL